MMVTKQKIRSKRGVSLIIALVLITVISAFSLGVYASMLMAIRTTSASNNSNMAYYAAEGALEMGLLENSNNGAGFSDSKVVTGVKSGCKLGDQVGNCCAVGDQTCNQVFSNCKGSGSYKDQTSFNSCLSAGMVANQQKISSEYTISGQVPANKKLGAGNYSGMYTIPAPGTGSAGKDCDPLKANYSKKFSYQYYDISNNLIIKNDVDPSDDACNWNRLKVGETESIPLFVAVPGFKSKEGSPEGIKNPKDLELNSLYIRVRTPCEDERNVNCPGLSRIRLDVTSDTKSQFGGDDPVMSWQISGSGLESSDNYVLSPIMIYSTDDMFGTTGWDNQSTAIIESSINNSLNIGTPIIRENSNGIDLSNVTGTVLNFINNDNPWNKRKINKPVLKLSVISNLKAGITKDTVPYLEYQVISNVKNTENPTDSSQTIVGSALVGGYKAVVQSTLGQNNSITDYVIQQ